jgi:cytochrome c553
MRNIRVRSPPAVLAVNSCHRKRRRVACLILGACVYGTGTFAASAPAIVATAPHDWSDMPLWAYGVASPPHAGDRGKSRSPFGRSLDLTLDRDEQFKPLHVGGSRRTYTLLDLSDWHNPADCFPDEHVPLPNVVAHGPASLGEDSCACAYCHKVTGGGRPDNAPVAGLPVTYLLRQLDDFRHGRRSSSDPRKSNSLTMIALAEAISREEALAAANYYAAQTGGPTLRVIETDRVPPAHLHGNRFVASGKERTESLVGRILEVAVDPRQSEQLDNPHFGYIAYVPRGSIARGRRLVTNSSNEPAVFVCASCHGPNLRGLADVPPIAGRSPSYLVRELYDFKTGARNGTQAAQMQAVVARLTTAQITDIAAYLASRPRVAADPR